MHNQRELTRRQFMAYTAVGAAGLMLPAVGEAGIWTCIRYAARLQPTRLIAGLIFDVGKAVVVSLVSDAIVSSLSSRRYSRSVAYSRFGSGTRGTGLGSLKNERDFTPVPYKASVITLGIADYELHPKRKIKMALTGDAEKQRFGTVLRYLQDERIRIQIGQMEYARPANEFRFLEPDDLLTLQSWDLVGEQERHVQELITATGVSAFNHLTV
ncbi:Tat (Twin-arginine translocation) pathway signal sequence [Candidatus Electrothrix laxa]